MMITTSNAGTDVNLVLASNETPLTQRFLPDGGLNRVYIRTLE